MAIRAQEVIQALAAQSKAHLSMRRACRVLEISPHTLEDWERRGLIMRAIETGGKFAVSDLVSLIKAMNAYSRRAALPPSKASRFGAVGRFEFAILECAEIQWPRSEQALTPSELAARIGCHPSTIIRGIRKKCVPARRRSCCRWEIRRKDWNASFPLTIRETSKRMVPGKKSS